MPTPQLNTYDDQCWPCPLPTMINAGLVIYLRWSMLALSFTYDDQCWPCPLLNNYDDQCWPCPLLISKITCTSRSPQSSWSPYLHLIFTSSSPHLHLMLTSSSPHLHLIFTSSSPHLHLIFTSLYSMIWIVLKPQFSMIKTCLNFNRFD